MEANGDSAWDGWTFTGGAAADGAQLVLEGEPACRILGRSDGSVRVWWECGADYYEEVLAGVLDRTVAAPLSWTLVSAGDGDWTARAGEIRVDVSRAGRLRVASGAAVWEITLGRDAEGFGGRLALGEEEGVYGLGEKVGALDKRGGRYVQWATDAWLHTPSADPLYQAIPFTLLAGPAGARGVFLASAARSVFDAQTPGCLQFGVERGALVLELLPGPTPAEVLDGFTRLTGRPALPPWFALGLHQSRWSYESADEVRAVAAEYRRRRIPLDAIFLDIDYMDGFRVFTWDPIRFAEPRRLVADLDRQDVRLVPIIDVGVKVDPAYRVYREGAEGDHFLRTPGGEPFEGYVWPGLSRFPDFAAERTRRWWAHLNRALAETGAAGIWNDMNEPAVRDAEQHLVDSPAAEHRLDDGRRVPHAAIHNAYALLEARATYDGLRAAHSPARRPFILSRSGFAGIQRYAAVWTGDNHSWWEHLALSVPMCLNLSLSGVPLVGADVGGFFGRATPELMARWLALGSMLPYFRIHSAKTAPRQEPWVFGEDVVEAARRFAGLRYRLLPYWASLLEEAHRTGTPPLRPLFWHFPDGPETFQVSDEFLVGPFLLVAPLLQPGIRHRAVYLPAGRWWDVQERRWREGPGWHVAHATLQELPRYWRAGAVVPTAREGMQSTREWSAGWAHGQDGPDGFTLWAGDGRFAAYSDDGETVGPEEEGLWRRIVAQVETAADGAIAGRFHHSVGSPRVAPLCKTWTLTAGPLPPGPVRVVVDGATVAASTLRRVAETADGDWWAVSLPVRLNADDELRIEWLPDLA